jgi:protease-4
MKFPHLFTKLFCTPLALRDVERMAFESYLLGRIETPKHEAMERMRTGNWRVDSILSRYGDVAVIAIHGVIDKRISAFEMECYGGCDLADIDSAISIVANDATISTVVLDINSPGGSVTGVAETGARIAALAEIKEVHAFVDVMACSAGYWLASQADHITANPSAIVGSIGVYMALLDASRWMEDEGLRVQMIKAGKWKDTGSSHRPLTDEETERLQAGVDELHAEFKAACTARRKIAADTMEGQWMKAAEGKALGLVDDVTFASLDEFVASLI